MHSIRTKTYFIYLSLLFLLIPTTKNAQIYKLDLDSLWNIVRSEKSADTLKVNALSKIASQYFNTNPDSTLFFLDQSIKLSQSIGFTRGEGRGYMNKGAIYSYQGETSLAAEYTLKALEAMEKISDTAFQVQILVNLSELMLEMGEKEKGLNYAIRAKQIAFKSQNILSKIIAINILAAYKENEGEFKEAIVEYKSYLKLSEENKIVTPDYFYSLVGLASCYQEVYNDFDSSIQWLNKARPMLDKLNSINLQSSYYQYASKLYLDFHKIEQAELYADSLKSINSAVGGKKTLIAYYLLMADIAEEKGLYKAAYNNYKKAKLYEDTLKDEKKQETILALEMKYNSERKGKELLLKKAELEKNNIEIESQKNQKFIMMVIFGLGTLFTWFVIFSYFKNKKKNKLLEAQNEELEKLSIVAKEVDSTVIIANKDGMIEWINEGAIQMYNLSPKEIAERIGKDIRKLSNFQGISTVLNECIETKKSSFYTSKHFKKNGSILWVQTTLTPILNQNGEVNKIIFIDTNVSAVKKSEVKLTKQKELLEAKNSYITDSVNYAKRIQQAVLPSNQTLRAVWKDHFALLNPKDIVSGDFYWFYEKEGKKYLAVVDCTGHGVPGAFMTIIGNNLLNEILQDDLYKPQNILQELHIRIKLRLGGSKDAKVMDSMDLGIVCFDSEKQEIEFAGTHTSVYLVRGKSLSEYKGSKETIGFKDKIIIKSHKIKIQKGDMIYMHTDGYPDQKGGKKNKKFYYQPIRDMFINISQKDLEAQKNIIEETFNDWKKDTEQTDDVCVVGVRI